MRYMAFKIFPEIKCTAQKMKNSTKDFLYKVTKSG